jgi:hypothetical protein
VGAHVQVPPGAVAVAATVTVRLVCGLLSCS